jgi:hypothetical protein
MITHVTIFGERGSGTNYLEQLLLTNFDVKVVWPFFWKHFFGFHTFPNSDHILFLGIVRNVHDWINSVYRSPHHFPKSLTENEETFLHKEVYSVDDRGNEMMQDRNIYTKERYKNIFELRYVKMRFLLEDMPKLVQHYLLITHDNLLHNFVETMKQIQRFSLPVKMGIEFPINVSYYMKNKHHTYTKKPNTIPKQAILDKVNKEYESLLFPNDSMFECISTGSSELEHCANESLSDFSFQQGRQSL